MDVKEAWEIKQQDMTNSSPSRPYSIDPDDPRTQEKDEKWLAKLEKRFNVIAGDDNQIDLEEFKRALNVKKSFFAERFFELIDTDRSGSISLKELIGALRLLVYGSPQDKLHFLFQVYDADGSGFIEFDELKTVLHSCTAESALTLSDETLTELTEILFDDADVDGDGQVSFEELSDQLKRYPGITANLTISAAEWLNPRASKKKKGRESMKIACCSYHAVRNHFSLITFSVIYFLVNLALGAWGCYDGYHSAESQHPAALAMARGTGRCLSFNCCFVLVLMLRKLLTILRNSFLMSVLPLDQHVDIHKMVAVLILVFTVFHTIAHAANFALITLEQPNGTTLVEFLFTPVKGVGWVGGTSSITGFILIVILVIMALCSMPCIRRNGYFKVFYWTHQLCILFWALLIVHSATFWKWFVAPGVIYIAERVLRLQMYRRARFGITHIQEGFILPANVVHLVIQRPPNFKFHAGEYIYVNIPAIASHEWHPFTISSAPEQEEFMSLHIRSIGHWTKRLYDVFKEREEAQIKLNAEQLETGVEGDFPLESQVKPMEVLAEEGSLMGSLMGSLKGSISGSPLRRIGPLTPSKRAARKRHVSGETNSAYEAELTDDDSVVMGLDCNSSTVRDDASLDGSAGDWRSRTDSVNQPLPGLITDLNERSGTPVREVDIDECSTSGVATLNESSTPAREVKGKTITLSPIKKLNPATDVSALTQPLPSVQSVNGRDPVVDTTACFPKQPLAAASAIAAKDSPAPLPRRTESKLSRKLFSKAMSGKAEANKGGTKRQNSRKKMRRKHTLHSLDAARCLGGTPHTGMEIILDGPYGAPAQHIMSAEHAVLIGAGIGITPFASILQSIHARYKAAKKHCPNCHHAWVEDASTILKMQKVDFFWINRQQRSFEWFISLLNAIELEQAEIPVSGRFLDIHLYMTSALSPSDMKAIGLHVALDLIHKKNKRDTITGLMTRTQAGRPDWDEVFQNLKRQQRGKITVFFCGSPALGKIIGKKCLQYKVDFRTEHF
ncbi:NADPH oxidase 5-like [Diadema antillarum]|uniref:NADPH oxidase 5-like n=1 Tax=Diadema antillarum TaxID=105358 RepID=UPI003A8BC982